MNNLEFKNWELEEFYLRILKLRTDPEIPDFFASVSFFNICDNSISIRLIIFIKTNFEYHYNCTNGQYTIYWQYPK